MTRKSNYKASKKATPSFKQFRSCVQATKIDKANTRQALKKKLKDELNGIKDQ